jgi:hypothetical protein
MDFVPTPSKETLRILLACWAGLFMILSLAQWHSKRAVGVPLAYAFSLSLLHFPGALCYSMDYYSPRSPILVYNGASLTNTFCGFYVSTVALASFVFGVLACSILFPVKNSSPIPVSKIYPAIGSRLPGTMLLTALISFVILVPTIGRIPSFGAVTLAGAALGIVAIFLFAYRANLRGNSFAFWKWVFSAGGFPMVTLVTMGFANSGTQAALTVWMFVYRLYRPRVLALLGLCCLLFAAMTFYVNYMRERDSIRSAVWGQRALSTRLQAMQDMTRHFQFFNPYNHSHLESLDSRLNQNDLVGKAVIHIASGRVDFGRGGTLYAAAVAWVPRILWPNKPSTGGSGSMVSRFTGQVFSNSTSVGVGQVLEFYVNWGLTSVILGFVLYGILMRYLDERAAIGLVDGDYWRFCRWVLPAMGLLQSGGSFSEVVGTCAANTVLVTLLHQFYFKQFYNTTPQLSRQSNRPSPIQTYRGSK